MANAGALKSKPQDRFAGEGSAVDQVGGQLDDQVMTLENEHEMAAYKQMEAKAAGMHHSGLAHLHRF